METKLDYIPEKVYKVFQNNIIEYVKSKTAEERNFKFPMFDCYREILFSNELRGKDYVGTFYSKDNSFSLVSDFYLTKKEAYDAYVKELENQIKELNDKAFKLQMEALDVIGDLNCFMEQYKELEENE